MHNLAHHIDKYEESKNDETPITRINHEISDKALTNLEKKKPVIHEIFNESRLQEEEKENVVTIIIHLSLNWKSSTSLRVAIY